MAFQKLIKFTEDDTDLSKILETLNRNFDYLNGHLESLSIGDLGTVRKVEFVDGKANVKVNRNVIPILLKKSEGQEANITMNQYTVRREGDEINLSMVIDGYSDKIELEVLL